MPANQRTAIRFIDEMQRRLPFRVLASTTRRSIRYWTRTASPTIFIYSTRSFASGRTTTITTVRVVPLMDTHPTNGFSPRQRASAVIAKYLSIRPSLHLAWLRYSSVTDSRFAPSSRLARRAHRRPRCTRDFTITALEYHRCPWTLQPCSSGRDESAASGHSWQTPDSFKRMRYTAGRHFIEA